MYIYIFIYITSQWSCYAAITILLLLFKPDLSHTALLRTAQAAATEETGEAERRHRGTRTNHLGVKR